MSDTDIVERCFECGGELTIMCPACNENPRDFDAELLQLRGEVERLTKDVATEREKFRMHTAHVGAWLGAMTQELNIEAVNVEDGCAKVYQATAQTKARADALQAQLEAMEQVLRDTRFRMSLPDVKDLVADEPWLERVSVAIASLTDEGAKG